MRLMTWNVAWMNALFDAAGQPLADDGPGGRIGVSRAAQLEAIGIVLSATDPDALLIQEAPDHRPDRPLPLALERLARCFDLRQSRAITGFASDTQQELALLYDPAVLRATHAPRGGPGRGEVPRLDAQRPAGRAEGRPRRRLRFSRPPLEVAVQPVGGRPFRLIGVHLKSKLPHHARSPAQAQRQALDNRRTLLAQCKWLRARIEADLALGGRLIVLGDFNDGPGLDRYETLLGRSGVEIVMGAAGPPALRLVEPHAEAPDGQSSARFAQPGGQTLEALLDFIMVSPDLAAGPPPPRWRIWHPLRDPLLGAVPELAAALLTASDHFPVTFDFMP